MPIIFHHKDPANITKPDRYKVKAGINLLDWMFERWDSSEEMAGALSVSVILNGKVIFENEKDEEKLLNFSIGNRDNVSIVNRPAATVVLIGVAFGVVGVAISLALAPSLPGDAGEQTDSPNNRLQAANNSFRPGEATPEIFGSVVSYPDFIQPTYFEYVDNLRIVSEFGYIGEGRYQIGEVRNGETAFNTIPGSSFQIFQPAATIPADLLRIVRPAEPADGQVLLPPDSESIQQDGQIDSISGGGASNVTLTLIEGSTLATDLALVIGGFISLSEFIFTLDGAVLPIIGTYQIANLSIVSQRTVIEIDSMTPITVSPGNIVIASTDQFGLINNYVGYFDIPGAEAEEIWFNWQMPRGIQTESGRQLSVDVQFQIERLNNDGTPSGVTFTQAETITGRTLDGQFRTTKFIPAIFPGMTRAQYRGRLRRLTEQAEGSAAQEVRIEQILSVTPYASFDNSTGTTISFRRRATIFALSSSGNRNNLDVVRMLPAYNRNTGVYEVSNLQATRSFADAAAYNLIVWAGRSASAVDLEELYGIADGLLHSELGYFDFTFDNKNVGLGERIESVCNVARVNPFRDGAIWRFTRDEVKPVRSAMFNRRVTVNNSSTQNYLLQRPDDKDSVALTYVDPTSNVERILYRRADSSGNIVDNGPGAQALEINLAGCRNFFQAWNRVNLEMRRIIYQRRTVTDKTRRDGMLVGLLDRVGWADPNDVNLFHGEIIGFSGNVYDTTERFEPLDSQTYVVYVTDNEGNPSNSVVATARTDTEFGFVASGLSGIYLSTGDGEQLGSRYFIGLASDITASDFLVTSRRPQSDGSTDLEMVEYRPEMYELDTANPPQPAVIFPASFSSTNISSINTESISTLTIGTDGVISGTGVNSQSFTAGTASFYEAMLTQSDGEAIAGSDLNVWLPITSQLQWMITRGGASEGSTSANSVLQIRDRSFNENINLVPVSFNAVVGGALSLPSTISVFASEIGAPSRAAIEFLSNGNYREIANNISVRNYVTTADGIGFLYEIMATITSGVTPGGSPIGVWINLGGSAVNWEVTASGGFEVSQTVINVQIREVANNDNLASSAVTLRAETEA